MTSSPCSHLQLRPWTTWLHPSSSSLHLSSVLPLKCRSSQLRCLWEHSSLSCCPHPSSSSPSLVCLLCYCWLRHVSSSLASHLACSGISGCPSWKRLPLWGLLLKSSHSSSLQLHPWTIWLHPSDSSVLHSLEMASSWCCHLQVLVYQLYLASLQAFQQLLPYFSLLLLPSLPCCTCSG